jgi:PhnB protein
MSVSKTNAHFAPQLFVDNVADAVKFYEHGLGAKELRHWANADGSIHVTEMEIGGSLFHIHEQVSDDEVSPRKMLGATTVTIGILVNDPGALVSRAVASGAKLDSPVKDYDYGLRQGSIIDPSGHHWLIEKRI